MQLPDPVGKLPESLVGKRGDQAVLGFFAQRRENGAEVVRPVQVLPQFSVSLIPGGPPGDIAWFMRRAFVHLTWSLAQSGRVSRQITQAVL